MLPKSGKADAQILAIPAGRARIDAAADLLFRYDPDHHPMDYVLTIAEAISGHRYQRRDGRIWTDEGALDVHDSE